MPDEEAEHILRLIDAELKGTEGYEKCNNDPKKALGMVFHAKMGRLPKKEIGKRALTNLRTKLDALFASLPRTRVLSLEHFYANKLRVLKLSEPEREQINAKEARGSARCFEAADAGTHS